MKTKSGRFLTSGSVLLILTFLLASTISSIKTSKYLTRDTVLDISSQKPIPFSYSWNGPGLSTTTINFNQEQIYVTANIDNSLKMSEGDTHEELYIKKEDYPMLFDQGELNENQINSYQLTNISDKYGTSLIAIVNEQPSHGDYSIYYGVIVSPFEGKVVFETPEYFLGKRFPAMFSYPQENYLRLNFEYYGTDFCNSCNLNFLDIYEYDPESAKFELANSKHVDELYRYLTQYKKRAEAGCFYDGETRSFEEIRKLGGDSAECQSSGDFEITNPLKMGKFFAIYNRLERIIDNENISMFE